MSSNSEILKALIKEVEYWNDKLSDMKIWLEFHSWLDENKSIREYKGLKRGSIIGLRDRLKDLDQEYEEKKNDDLLSIRIRDIKYEPKANAFIKACKSFFDEYSESDPFLDKIWYLYFFCIPPGGEPQLARFVIKMTRPNFAEMDYLDFSNRKHKYYGSFSTVHNRVCTISLRNNKNDYRYHIMVNYHSSGEEQILIGSYLTYSNQRLMRGSVVMELAKGDLAPMFFSYEDLIFDTDIKDKTLSKSAKLERLENKKQEFKKVNPNIKKFLLVKNYNYYITPNDISKYELLGEFLNTSYENYYTRFIEDKLPRLYIASPGLSVSDRNYSDNSKQIKALKEDLDLEFANEIKVKFYDQRKNQGKLTEKTLTKLKKTRYFILIYTQTQSGSLSLIQLGWAMAYCKHVMIFYEEKSISEHITSLPDEVIKIPFKNLEKDIGVIYKEIVEEVNRTSYEKDRSEIDESREKRRAKKREKMIKRKLEQ